MSVVGFLTGYLKLRPTRIGFLVRPSNLRGLRSIFQLCSCLWGGMYNPIIPVSRSIPAAWRRGPHRRPAGRELAQGYVRFFEPDVFVETEPGLARSIGIANIAHPSLRSRVVTFVDFMNTRDGYGPHSTFPFGLSMLNVYRELYRTEGRFVHRRDMLVAEFDDSTHHGAYLDAVFGGFPEYKELLYLQQAFHDTFNPTTLMGQPSSWIRLFKEHGHTPLTFTHHDLTANYNSGWDLRVFVMNPRSPLDLLDLWNLRLVQRAVLPVSSEWLPDLKEYVCDLMVRNHHSMSRNGQGLTAPSTVQVGNSFSAQEAEDLVRDAFCDLPTGTWRIKLRYDPIWTRDYENSGSSISPVRIQAESAQIEVPVVEENGSTIRFQALSPGFAPRHGVGHAAWVNGLSLKDYGNRHRLALALPSTAVSAAYHGGIDPLLVDREGFVLLQRFKDHRHYVMLMSGRKAVVDWFKRHGVDAAPSGAGRVADQMLSSLDGLSRIWILQDIDTLTLLDKMAKKAERTMPVKEWLKVIRRRPDARITLEPVKTILDAFVEAGAIKSGLAVPCPNCDGQNWYGLDDLAQTVSCERCLKQFRFPEGTLDYNNSPWKFRVTGPYSVPNYANGAYATLLALNCLVREEGHDATVTLSTNLDLQVSGERMEIDFACWMQRDDLGYEIRSDPVFLIGEAKSFAQNGFCRRDVDRLKQVGRRMPGTFLVCATLKSELSRGERNLIGGLAKWGRRPYAGGHCRNPVIVLTGTEMFAPVNMQEAWKEREELSDYASVEMGEPRNLADLTQQAYLGLPPLREWLWEYRSDDNARRSKGIACTDDVARVSGRDEGRRE